MGQCPYSASLFLLYPLIILIGRYKPCRAARLLWLDLIDPLPSFILYSPLFRQTKAEFMYEIEDPFNMFYCTFGYGCLNGRKDLYNEILEVIATKMNMEASLSRISVFDDISDSVLDQAAEIYIYLVTDEDRFWMHWYKMFRDILECRSLARSIGEYN